jgi:hypothetical protein
MNGSDVSMGGFNMLCTRIFCSLSGLVVALVVGGSSAADAQTTALRGARVIDGRGAAPLDNATIVIRDGVRLSLAHPFLWANYALYHFYR